MTKDLSMIHLSLTLSYLQLYIAIISFISFVIYAYDKLQSLKNTRNISRVSENKLLLSSFIGGTIGSILSMIIFRHKIKKVSFIIKFLLLVIVQVILIFLYLKNYLFLN